jgi:predicted MPP superfamily phosphohydrolase
MDPPYRKLASALIAGGAVASAWAVVEPTRLKVRRLDVPLDDWPDALGGLRVAVVADLHAGAPHVDLRKVERVVAKVNAQKPDMVALLGDYADPTVAFGEAVAPEEVAERLAELRAPLGVFAVLGNHDWVHYGRRVPKALRHAGIEVLENDAVAVEHRGSVLWVGGLADPSERDALTSATLAMVPRGQPLIALTHDPDLFPGLRDRAAVTLAGHTHGGQLNVPLLRRLIGPSEHGYIGGEVREGRGYMYVSRGVGTAHASLRIGAPPEIAVLTLRPASGVPNPPPPRPPRTGAR